MPSNINPEIQANQAWNIGSPNNRETPFVDERFVYDSSRRVIGVINANGEEQLIKDNTKNAIIRKNLIEVKDVSYLNLQQITGGVVMPDPTKNALVCTLPAGATGRAFTQAVFGFDVNPNFIYAFSFTVDSIVGELVSGDKRCFLIAPFTCINQETTPTFNFIDLKAGKKYFSLFRPDVAGTVTFRCGIGSNANVTAGTEGATIVIRDICLENLTVSGSRYPSLYAVPLKSSVAVVDESVVSVEGNVLSGTLNTLPGTSVAIFGDSYVNDDSDYPNLLLGIGEIGVWVQHEISPGVTTASKKLIEFLLHFERKLQLLIDSGCKPRYVYIQSSLNTLNDSNPSTRVGRISTDFNRLQECVLWALSKGIMPILTTVAPWKSSAAYWYTAGIHLDQMAWDSAVYNLAATYGLNVFDLRAVINDPADPYSMLAANTSDGGIHPNSTGMALLATALNTFIKSI